MIILFLSVLSLIFTCENFNEKKSNLKKIVKLDTMIYINNNEYGGEKIADEWVRISNFFQYSL